MKKAKKIMDDFMEKLENNTFKKDVLQENGEELNSSFVKQQVNSYGQMMQSGILNNL